MNLILKEIKNIFKNANICKSRGHQPHIRVTKFDKEEFESFKILYKDLILYHCKDSSFSSSYKTYKEPKEIKYKIHYWSNCFAPTNNLLGFKSIY